MTLFNCNRVLPSRRIVSRCRVFDKVDNKLRELLRRFFMGQMPKPRHGVNARIGESMRQPTRVRRRNGFVVVGDDQINRQAQARQIAIERVQIPLRHHAKRAGDVGGIAHQSRI